MTEPGTHPEPLPTEDAREQPGVPGRFGRVWSP